MLRRNQSYFSPRNIPGLVLWLDASQTTLVREAGMAGQFTAATLEYLSNAGTAGLRGGTTWWRAGWVYLNTAAAMTIQSCLGTNVGYLLSINATPALVLEVGSGSATSIATHGTTLTTATWYFVYAYYDGTNVGISLNDGADVTTALASYSAGATAWNMGALVTPGTYFNGRMQCHFGGDGTLTAAQRTKLYNSGTPLAYDQLDPLVRNGLTFAFELNEPSGTRADLAGTNNLTDNNTVTTNPGTVLNAVGAVRDLSGQSNNATQTTQASKPVVRGNGISNRNVLSFDSVDDYISVADSNSIDLTTQLTIEMWEKPSSANGVANRLVDKSNGGSGGGYMISANDNGFELMIHDGTNPSDALDAGANTFTVGTWSHAVATFDNGLMILYVNGVEKTRKTSTVTTAQVNTNNLAIGSSSTPSQYHNGTMGSVRIYNRALNRAEIIRLYQADRGKYG